MSELLIKQVSRPLEAIDIALVRNTGRDFMTHDQHEISQHEQFQWYQKTYVPANLAGNMYAFCTYDGADPVGYGLVRRAADGKYWITGVIVPAAQGKGFGERLFRFLTEFALYRASEVWLEVLETNDRAQKLYEKLGYELDSANGNKFTMVKRGVR